MIKFIFNFYYISLFSNIENNPSLYDSVLYDFNRFFWLIYESKDLILTLIYVSFGW